MRSGLRGSASGAPAGRSLGAQTVGLIGYGRIARAVVQLLAPWNPRILVSHAQGADRHALERVLRALTDLLSTSDVISIHAALNASTARLLDAAAIARMRPSAVLINTARGGIVDEGALAEALESGRLRGAALDCFEQEPLPLDSPCAAHRARCSRRTSSGTLRRWCARRRRPVRRKHPESSQEVNRHAVFAILEALDPARPERSTTS